MKRIIFLLAILSAFGLPAFAQVVGVTATKIKRVTSDPAGAACQPDDVRLYLGQVYTCQSSVFTVATGASSILPVADTQTLVKGSATASKLLRIEVDGLTSSTTRVWTALDANIVVAGSASALTSGRWPYVTTGGILEDSANATLTSGGAGYLAGTLSVGTTGTSAKFNVQGASNAAQDLVFWTLLNGNRLMEFSTNASGHPTFRINNASGTAKLNFNGNGDSYAAGGRFCVGCTSADAALHVAPLTDITIGQIIKGLAGHGVDLLQFRASDDTIQGGVSSDGTKWYIGGKTSSFPMLKRSSTGVQFRLADDSAFAPITASAVNLTSLAFTATAPTVTSAGTSPSITASNGTAAGVIDVGTGGTATTIVLAMPTATTGWNCHATNVTATAANRADQAVRQTASTTTSVTLQNQTVSTGAALAFTASDSVRYTCTAY